MDKKKIKKLIRKKFDKIYISYPVRILICFIVLFITLGLSLLFLSKTLDINEAKVINYQEIGNIDYKVYLKENEFYDQLYLERDMYYIASVIDTVNVDINYNFLIEEQVDMDFSYKIIGNLTILDSQSNNKLFEKEYVLKDLQKISNEKESIQTIKDNVVIDYDYYNELANRFKSTYGVDVTSNLIIYVVVNKDVKNEEEKINLNNTKEMTLTIPLSQKTLNIKIDDTQINNADKFVNESKIGFKNIVCGVIFGILFICVICLVLRLIELLFLLVPKSSKYDKYIKRILNEYDRLIVETPTEPRLENKEIIKINRIEELLDARDNLKRPIMYYNLINHQKCHFYIEKENTVYLLTIKSVDLEKKK